MHLNLEKCTFGVRGGKFLGFMITHKGIEANLNKCVVIINMQSLTSVKEVQRPNDRIASLSHFLPKLAEKARPFYKLLKKTESFI